MIKSKSYYLLADASWSSVKLADWPLADYEEAITLTNSNAGLALKNGSEFVDALGWGTASKIENGLYEGTPHSGVDQGKILARKIQNDQYQDTNNNSADFVSSDPSFKNSSSTKKQSSGHQININLVVEGDALTIKSAQINSDDDSFKEGIQINPIPKSSKSFEVQAVVNHVRGKSNIKKVKAVLNGTDYVMTSEAIDANSATYKANVSMSYAKVSGDYNISIEAEANDGFVTTVNLSFTYTSLTAMEVDTAKLNFSALPGAQSEAQGDTDMSSITKTTLRNVGNTLLDIELLGTDLTNNIGSVSVGNISYTFNNDYAGSLGGSLSDSKQKKPVGLGISQMLPLSFRVSVPQTAKPGNYTGKITLIAVGR